MGVPAFGSSCGVAGPCGLLPGGVCLGQAQDVAGSSSLRLALPVCLSGCTALLPSTRLVPIGENGLGGLDLHPQSAVAKLSMFKS